ncbi:polysaccharide biosynthesis/export family protein [Pedobacter sp. SD-b]|uniref:Polysaccharide biosynthesis/export family protein n=1 Tax=Pedobacter segetis TaxID=2793069 RepID=A0ABS1BH11_9SPHI|nr:polysaccharide biosynthesis/export family protein [Pedobacter segetis]MBK0381656.1 polysaccharide biosynthesis/export family protein [Pedobacter segetis]
MNKTYIFLLLLFATLISSCSSYKNIPYFQDLNHNKATEEQVSNYSPLTIQPGDILGVNVNSRNPESSAIFNYNLNRVNGNNFDYSSENPVTGYLVNEKGEIELPLIGILKVSDLTTLQVREKLRPLLLNYYKDATVNVRLINFKIYVYGDVQNPNVFTLRNERATVTQALAMAGDLNITAKRKNVILVREIDGVRKYIPIDLTSKKIFESPYYYLKNNDEIYVEPSRTKYAPVDIGYRTLTLVLSALSIVAITLTTFKL